MTDTPPEVKGLEWHFVADLLALYARSEFAAERIKELREERGWSTDTLAKKVTAALRERNPSAKNVAQSTIWRIENPGKESGNSSITIDMLLAIARVFDKTVADMLLPASALEEVQGWELYQQAANLLNEMRRLNSEYVSTMERLRHLVTQRPSLESQIRDYLDGRYAKLDAIGRDDLFQEGRTFTDAAIKEARLRYPLPVVRAAEDALSGDPLHQAAWTHTTVTSEDLVRHKRATRQTP